MTAPPKSVEATKPSEGPKAINLALQGGGSHGAFTWGVLDRLLEDERLTFDGITATGAGSINAVVLADGLASGGRITAKKHLETFWTRMSEIVLCVQPVSATPLVVYRLAFGSPRSFADVD
jgi:NTE family protein